MKRFSSLRIATFISISRFFVAVIGIGTVTAFSLYFIYHCGEQSNLRKVEDMGFLINHVLEDPLYRLQMGTGSADELASILSSNLAEWPDVRYTVLDTAGSALLPETLPQYLSGETLDAPEVQRAASGHLSSAIRDDSHGDRTIFVASKVNHLGKDIGIVVLAAPFHQRMNPSYHTMLWVGIIAVIMMLAIVLEGLFTIRYVSGPIVRLSQAAERLSQGDLSVRAEPEGPAEAVHLATTFNIMTSQLKSSLDSLHAFVSNASHELRTPLTSMKLYIGALRDGALDEPEVAQRFLAKIDSEIDRLVHMVNDLLVLSQIENGDQQRSRQVVNLYDLACEVQAIWEARSRHHGLHLTLHAQKTLPVIDGDPFRLRQMFDNLIDNAIKNTPAGGSVAIHLYPCASPHVVRIEIQDTGIGITPDAQTHLFERFYRVDTSSRVEQSTGGGLGLAIVKSIVQAHNGKIGVNSLPGMGSTFWIELPVHEKI